MLETHLHMGSAASALALALTLSACQSIEMRSTGGAAPPIAPPPKEGIRYSDYRPALPYKVTDQGVLSRELFAAPGGDEYRVSVRELALGPKRSSREIEFAGAALLEVRAGAGMIAVDGKQTRLATGSALTVSQGQRIVLTNTSEDQGLELRAVVISAQ